MGRPEMTRAEATMFEGEGPSPLSEAVWALLDDAGAPNSLCEQVDKLINEWECEKALDDAEEATYRLWNPEP